MASGMDLAYALAERTLVKGHVNRVVVLSDGDANVGASSHDEILKQIEQYKNEGITLSTVGFGNGNYKDTMMEQLADKGDGFYAYVNTFDDATTLFGTKLTSTLDTVALDAKAQVEFNPDVVEAYRLLGYENRAIPDQQFRDDEVDAGAIGAGHAATALYAIRLTGGGEGLFDKGTIGTIRVRWSDPVTRKASEIAREVHVDNLAGSFEATAPTFKLDAIVAAAAERFREGRWAVGYDVTDVAAVADELEDELPQSDQVHDLLTMLDEAGRLER